jgi:5-methylthioadenosine/S-adenosylhomocysteine deaminase
MRLTLDLPLLLRGKIVQPDGTGLDRYVLVRNGQIVSVSRRRPPLTNNVVYVEAGYNDWIFPGLIDLHTHTDYNALPIWEAKKAPFQNRFQWRGDASYQSEVRDVFSSISSNRKVNTVFAELQAIAGGTAVLQESQRLEGNTRQANNGNPLLCRGTADPADLNLESGKEILSVIDFFKPNADSTRANPTTLFDAYLQKRESNKLQATLVHLAEGRSGFGEAEDCDSYSRLEFETLMSHPAFQDVEAVRSSAFTMVHCSGINVEDPAHINFLRERGISVVWSPVSNLLLYHDTLDVQSLMAEGINVALGSDWSPSGSKHLWDEAKFARFYFDAIGSPISDEQIFQMVTTNAAQCLGLHNLDRIEAGCPADFFILRSPLESDNALEVFFKTTDRHVRAVIIGGRPIYGAREFLQEFAIELQNLPPKEGSAVADKAVHIPAWLEINVERDFNKLEDTLKERGLKRNNLLADADTPYREKLSRLRQKVMSYGWQVQVWRRKKQKKRGLVRLLPVPPDAVRVWRGFRADNLDPIKFREKLGTLLIPSTVQLQAPLGLTAYLPAVLPDGKADAVPDEIALVFYESQDAYQSTFKTLAGRAYAELQQSVFAAHSQSGFPVKLGDSLEPGTPYYLFDTLADWHYGTCKVLVGTPVNPQDTGNFLSTLHKWLIEEQRRAPEGLDGAIICASESSFIYWEHWYDTALARQSRIKSLAKLVHPVLLENAKTSSISAKLHTDFAGVEIAGGECLNFQFQRSSLK